MRTIKTVIFGLFCFLTGSIMVIMMFLKKIIGNRNVCERIIVPNIRKMIIDAVIPTPAPNRNYVPYYKYYEPYNTYKTFDVFVNSKMDFIKSVKFKTYDQAERAVKDIKYLIQEDGKCTINDILDIVNEEDRQWYKGDDYGYDSRHFYSIGVNPNGSYGNWTIKFDNFPVLLSR